MLKFKLKDTVCTIDDDYNIECKGSQSERLQKIWRGVLSLSEPSLPCPIDEMHGLMEMSGAEILEYEQEYNPDLVY